MEAMEWDAARTALQAHLASNPPARVCRLMARIEAGQNRDLGRAREWLAKAARGAPDPVWVAPDGTVSREWHAVAPRSGALGAFEWKTPPAMPAAVSGDGLAGLPELDAPVAEVGPVPASPAGPAAGAAEPEIIPPAKANARELRSEAGPARDAQLSPAGAGDEKGEEERRRGAGPGSGAAGASTIQIVPRAGPGTPKPEVRKPKIFVPGPAPDDPGPRLPESEETSTLLSRFRRPS
jgi:uncharacterized membrane-anchored protein